MQQDLKEWIDKYLKYINDGGCVINKNTRCFFLSKRPSYDLTYWIDNTLNPKIKSGEWTDEEVKLINQIPFSEDDDRALYWNEWFKMLSKYHKPGDIIPYALTEGNYQIGKWYFRQCRNIKNLTTEQYYKLADYLPTSRSGCHITENIFDAVRECYNSKDVVSRLKNNIDNQTKMSWCNNGIDIDGFDYFDEYDYFHRQADILLREVLSEMYDLKDSLEIATCHYGFTTLYESTDNLFDEDAFVFLISIKNMTDKQVKTNIHSFYIVHNNISVEHDGYCHGYMDMNDTIEPNTLKTAGVYFCKSSLKHGKLIDGDYVVFVINDNTNKIQYSSKFVFERDELNFEYTNKRTFAGTKTLSFSDREIYEKLKKLKMLYDGNYISGIDYVNAKRVLLDGFVGLTE